MATNQINVGINVSSNGTTDKETKKAKGLKDMLDQTAVSAARAGRAMAASRSGGAGGGGGTPGSAEVMEYGRSRAVGVGTGASARDFANQAQGLGGLVRIYATLAANIFAATAAFSALSRAMDTTNMVRGLDQLGAASGTALGSLSKRLVIATEGAVSLREAMEATVKASSAGLNSEQILRLGQVSKTAAQALGLNMTDALSRLSRGISKLEPELLDELGIFVRIDDAVKNYALSVGKTASSLTDFERRQAFANAVLEQGERKFGEIDIATNPYTKLAAALQNLAQTGLELVNKFLAPVAKILADNSGLLTAAIALLSAKLVGMAIPALGQWRQGLVVSAKQARESATQISESFGASWVDRMEKTLKLPDLRAEVSRAQAELSKLGPPKGLSTAYQNYFNLVKSGTQLESGQVGAVTKLIGDKQKAIDALGTSQSKQSRQTRADYQAQIAQLKALKTANDALKAASGPEATMETAAGRRPSILRDPGAWMRETVSRRSAERAISTEALSRVSGDTLEKGFVGAMKTLNKELVDNKVGLVRRFTTLTVGSLAAATTAVGLFASAVQGYVAAFALIGGGLFAVLNYFSNTKKEAELTADAFDRMSGAVKNSMETMERLSLSKDPLAMLSVEGINARANALGELADSMQIGLVRAFNELDKMNASARILDFISGAWGGDVETKLAKNLADTIQNSFKAANVTPATTAAKQRIEEILGTGLDNAEIPDILEKLIEQKDRTSLQEITKLIKNLGDEQRATAAKGTELRESMSKVTKTLQEFRKSLAPTDILYKIATDGTKGMLDFNTALQDPLQSLNAMKNVAGNIDMLSLFPSDVALNLSSYKKELDDLALRMATAQSAAQAYSTDITELTKKIEELQIATRPGAVGASVSRRRQELADLISQRDQLTQSRTDQSGIIDALKSRQNQIKGIFDRAIGDGLIANSQLAASRINKEFVQGRTAISSFIANQLGDTRAGASARAQIERERINAEIQSTEATYNLSLTMDALNATIEENNLLEKRRQTQASMERPNADTVALQKDLDNIDKALSRVSYRSELVRIAQTGGKLPTPEGYLQSSRQSFRVDTRSIAGNIDPSLIDPATLELLREAREQVAKTVKLKAQLAVINRSETAEDQEVINKQKEQEFQYTQKTFDLSIQLLKPLEQIAGYNAVNLSKVMATLEATKTKQLLDRLESENARELLEYEQKVADLRLQGKPISLEKQEADKAAINLKYTEQLLVAKLNGLNNKILKDQEILTKEYERQQIILERRQTLQSLENNLSKKQSDFDKTRLDIIKDTNLLTNSQFVNLESANEASALRLEQEEAVNQLNKERASQMDVLNKQAQNITSYYEQLKQEPIIDPETLAEAFLTVQAITREVAAGNQYWNERVRLLNAQLGLDRESLALRQQDRALIAKFQDQQKKDDQDLERYQLIRQGEDMILDLARQRVEIERENGTISEDAYNQTIRGLEIERRERDLNNKQLEVTTKYQRLRNDLELRFQRALRAGGGVLDEYTAEEFQKERDRLSQNQALETANIERQRQGADELDRLRKDAGTRQKGYEDIFKGSFERMGDAIADWVARGDKSFKSFKEMLKSTFESMALEIVKFEMKLQAQELWMEMRKSSGGGSLLGSLFKNLFGGDGGALPGPGPTAFVGAQAKGGVFENMNYFAKGGAFTNSIVDNPTIFKFAKGVGMMGEAGPEAIMPLKRDSSGNLGVSGTGTKTDVVVNNYTGQQAETKETKDSRGNRRIEVIVGDMTAGEIGRPGSNTNRTMRETFGLQPQLIRR